MQRSVRDAEKIIESAGLIITMREQARKHLVLHVTAPDGRQDRITVSRGCSTPSPRLPWNLRAAARQIAR